MCAVRFYHFHGKRQFIKKIRRKSAQNSCFGFPGAPSGMPITLKSVIPGDSIFSEIISKNRESCLTPTDRCDNYQDIMSESWSFSEIFEENSTHQFSPPPPPPRQRVNSLIRHYFSQPSPFRYHSRQYILQNSLGSSPLRRPAALPSSHERQRSTLAGSLIIHTPETCTRHHQVPLNNKNRGLRGLTIDSRKENFMNMT